MFRPVDRFYVPSDAQLDSLKMVGFKLFFIHFLDAGFPDVMTVLMRLINECRDDWYHDDGTYLYDEKKWIIRDCIHTLRAFDAKLGTERGRKFLDLTDEAAECLVNGFVRRFEDKHKEIEVPAEIVGVIGKFRGRRNESVFKRYFYGDFVSQSVIYYSVASNQWMYGSKLSMIQFLNECTKAIKYEMDQLELWGVRVNERLRFKDSIVGCLSNEQSMREYQVKDEDQKNSMIEFLNSASNRLYIKIKMNTR